jgi:hypothetical protein
LRNVEIISITGLSKDTVQRWRRKWSIIKKFN